MNKSIVIGGVFVTIEVGRGVQFFVCHNKNEQKKNDCRSKFCIFMMGKHSNCDYNVLSVNKSVRICVNKENGFGQYLFLLFVISDSVYTL